MTRLAPSPTTGSLALGVGFSERRRLEIAKCRACHDVLAFATDRDGRLVESCACGTRVTVVTRAAPEPAKAHWKGISRPPKRLCRAGHDLTGRYATAANGACRECTNRRAREYTRRKRVGG